MNWIYSEPGSLHWYPGSLISCHCNIEQMWGEACCLPCIGRGSTLELWPKRREWCFLIQISFSQNNTFLKKKFSQLVYSVCFFPVKIRTTPSSTLFGQMKPQLRSELQAVQFRVHRSCLRWRQKYEKSDNKKCKHFKWVERVRCVYMFQRI